MIGQDPIVGKMIEHLKTLKRLRDWADKHGMKKDPKTYGGYHFATLYPTHVEEFWKIIGE